MIPEPLPPRHGCARFLPGDVVQRRGASWGFAAPVLVTDTRPPGHPMGEYDGCSAVECTRSFRPDRRYVGWSGYFGPESILVYRPPRPRTWCEVRQCWVEVVPNDTRHRWERTDNFRWGPGGVNGGSGWGWLWDDEPNKGVG